jgi:hypothetical protein
MDSTATQQTILVETAFIILTKEVVFFPVPQDISLKSIIPKLFVKTAMTLQLWATLATEVTLSLLVQL